MFDSFLLNAKMLKTKYNIKPLLYGSLGLEYISNHSFNPDDIDILIPQIYLKDKWNEFLSVMVDNGYELIDLHEHTFIKNNVKYSYASIEELYDFAGITFIEENDDFKYLSLKQYYEVYTRSLIDSYRNTVKNKNDQNKIDIIIKLLGEQGVY